MRRLRTTSPSHTTPALAALTLLGTLTACSMIGANAAVAASPPGQGSHQTGVVLDSAMDPTLSRQEATEGDATAAEQMLRTYIESQQGQEGFP